MIKKILGFLLSLLLLAMLFGCDHTSEDNTLVSDKFSSAPFSNIAEGDPSLSDEEMETVIAKIRSDKYELYPDTHSVPTSATLYKDGKAISIDADDQRLIKLINFFNNCVYYSKCSYTQGLLPLDYLEENINKADFRLELKYTPYGDTAPEPYGTSTTMCDTIIITNSHLGFTLIAHDLPGYEGEEESYPFRAVGCFPLYDNAYQWLGLFGF